MLVESHNKLANIQKFAATRVVIYDDFNNPIALAVQLDSGTYVTSTLGQPDFAALLQNCGVQSTTVITEVAHVPRSQLKFQ